MHLLEKGGVRVDDPAGAEHAMDLPGDDGRLPGVLSGDRMAARGHTTTIVEAPVYEAPVYEAPSIDSGFTYDSGSSVSDAGMSGGFDLDW